MRCTPILHTPKLLSRCDDLVMNIIGNAQLSIIKACQTTSRPSQVSWEIYRRAGTFFFTETSNRERLPWFLLWVTLSGSVFVHHGRGGTCGLLAAPTPRTMSPSITPLTSWWIHIVGARFFQVEVYLLNYELSFLVLL